MAEFIHVWYCEQLCITNNWVVWYDLLLVPLNSRNKEHNFIAGIFRVCNHERFCDLCQIVQIFLKEPWRSPSSSFKYEVFFLLIIFHNFWYSFATMLLAFFFVTVTDLLSKFFMQLVDSNSTLDNLCGSAWHLLSMRVWKC